MNRPLTMTQKWLGYSQAQIYSGLRRSLNAEDGGAIKYWLDRLVWEYARQELAILGQIELEVPLCGRPDFVGCRPVQIEGDYEHGFRVVAEPLVIIIETKVSCRDWSSGPHLNYLGYCNAMFYATPPGILKPYEIAPEIGLLESHICKRNDHWHAELKVLKEATHHDIEAPQLMAVAMSMLCASFRGGRNDKKDERWMKTVARAESYLRRPKAKPVSREAEVQRMFTFGGDAQPMVDSHREETLT